ncbi:exonuclease [Cystoisospora suis]|uniref:Exonuclease n=1 Tax=Cystoisospora suis TaxID=483139 RepID=A0A2C6L2H0_9APIC|nr:exonuclease [Cystoisospora suis]
MELNAEKQEKKEDCHQERSVEGAFLEEAEKVPPDGTASAASGKQYLVSLSENDVPQSGCVSSSSSRWVFSPAYPPASSSSCFASSSVPFCSTPPPPSPVRPPHCWLQQALHQQALILRHQERLKAAKEENRLFLDSSSSALAPPASFGGGPSFLSFSSSSCSLLPFPPGNNLLQSSSHLQGESRQAASSHAGSGREGVLSQEFRLPPAVETARTDRYAESPQFSSQGLYFCSNDHSSQDNCGSGESVFFQDGTRLSPVEMSPQVADRGSGSSCHFLCPQQYPVANPITYYSHQGESFGQQDYYGGLNEEQGRPREGLHMPYQHPVTARDGDPLFPRYYSGGRFELGEAEEQSERPQKNEKEKASSGDTNCLSQCGRGRERVTPETEDKRESVTAPSEPGMSMNMPASLQPFPYVFPSQFSFPHAEHAASAAGDPTADGIGDFQTLDAFASLHGGDGQEKAVFKEGDEADGAAVGLKNSDLPPQGLSRGGADPQFCYYQDTVCPPPVGAMWDPLYLSVPFIPPVQTGGMSKNEGCLDPEKGREDGELSRQEGGSAFPVFNRAPSRFPLYAQEPTVGGTSEHTPLKLSVDGTPKSFSFVAHAKGQQCGEGKGKEGGGEELTVPVDNALSFFSSTVFSDAVAGRNSPGQPGDDTIEDRTIFTTKPPSLQKGSQIPGTSSFAQRRTVFIPDADLPGGPRPSQRPHFLLSGEGGNRPQPVGSFSPSFAGVRSDGRVNSEYLDIAPLTFSPLQGAGLRNQLQAMAGFRNSSSTRISSGTEGHPSPSLASSALVHDTQQGIPEEQGADGSLYMCAPEMLSGELPENRSILNCGPRPSAYSSDRSESFCPGVASLPRQQIYPHQVIRTLSASPRTDTADKDSGRESMPGSGNEGSDSSSSQQRRGPRREDYQEPDAFAGASVYLGRSPNFGGNGGVVDFSNPHTEVHPASPVLTYRYRDQGYGAPDLVFSSYSQQHEPSSLFSYERQQYFPTGGDNTSHRRAVAVGEEREGDASTSLPRLFSSSSWDAREEPGHVLCVPDFLAEARRQQAERVGRQHRQQQLLLQRMRRHPGVARGRGGGWRQATEFATSRQRFGRPPLSSFENADESCDGSFFLSSSSPTSSDDDEEPEDSPEEAARDSSIALVMNGNAVRRAVFKEKESGAGVLDRDGVRETANSRTEVQGEEQKREPEATDPPGDRFSATGGKVTPRPGPSFPVDRSTFASSPRRQPVASSREEPQRNGVPDGCYPDRLLSSTSSCYSSCRTSTAVSSRVPVSAQQSSEVERECLFKGSRREGEAGEERLRACSLSSCAQSVCTDSAAIPQGGYRRADDADSCPTLLPGSETSEAEPSASHMPSCPSSTSLGPLSYAQSASIGCPLVFDSGLGGVQRQRKAPRESGSPRVTSPSFPHCLSVGGASPVVYIPGRGDPGDDAGNDLEASKQKRAEAEWKKSKKTKVREKGRVPSRYWNFSVWSQANRPLWCPAQRQRAARVWSLLNKTTFAGVEKLGCPTRDFVHAVVQQLFFLAPLKATLVAHQCSRTGCVACELGFLLHMLDLARKEKDPCRRICQSSNFQQLLGELPAARLHDIFQPVSTWHSSCCTSPSCSPSLSGPGRVSSLAERTYVFFRILLAHLHRDLKEAGETLSRSCPVQQPTRLLPSLGCSSSRTLRLSERAVSVSSSDRSPASSLASGACSAYVLPARASSSPSRQTRPQSGRLPGGSFSLSSPSFSPMLYALRRCSTRLAQPSIVEFLFCYGQAACEDSWNHMDGKGECCIVSLSYPGSSRELNKSPHTTSTAEGQAAARPEDCASQLSRQLPGWSPGDPNISYQSRVFSCGSAQASTPLTPPHQWKVDDPRGDADVTQHRRRNDTEGAISHEDKTSSVSPSLQGQESKRQAGKSFAELLEISLRTKKWFRGSGGEVGAKLSADLSAVANETEAAQREALVGQRKRENMARGAEDQAGKASGDAEADSAEECSAAQTEEEKEASVSQADRSFVEMPLGRRPTEGPSDETKREKLTGSEKERGPTDRLTPTEERLEGGDQNRGQGAESLVESGGAETALKKSCRCLHDKEEKEKLLHKATIGRNFPGNAATSREVENGTCSLPLVLLVYANIQTEADLAVWHQSRSRGGGQGETRPTSSARASGGGEGGGACRRDPGENGSLCGRAEDGKYQQEVVLVEEKGEEEDAATGGRRESTRAAASTDSVPSSPSSGSPFLSSYIWIGAPSDAFKDSSLAVRNEPFDKAIKYSLSAVLFSVRPPPSSESPSWETGSLRGSVTGGIGPTAERTEGTSHSPKERVQVSASPSLDYGAVAPDEKSYRKDSELPRSLGHKVQGAVVGDGTAPSVFGEVSGEGPLALFSACEGIYTESSERFSGSPGRVHQDTDSVTAFPAAETQTREGKEKGGKAVCRRAAVGEGTTASQREEVADTEKKDVCRNEDNGDDALVTQPESLRKSCIPARGEGHGDTRERENRCAVIPSSNAPTVGERSSTVLTERGEEKVKKENTRRPEESRDKMALTECQQSQKVTKPFKTCNPSSPSQETTEKCLHQERDLKGSLEDGRRHRLTDNTESLCVCQTASPSSKDLKSSVSQQLAGQPRAGDETVTPPDRKGGTDSEVEGPEAHNRENTADDAERKNKVAEQPETTLGVVLSSESAKGGEHEAQERKSVCKELLFTGPAGAGKEETEVSALGLPASPDLSSVTSGPASSAGFSGEAHHGPLSCAKAKPEGGNGTSVTFARTGAQGALATTALSSAGWLHRLHGNSQHGDSKGLGECKQMQAAAPSFYSSSPPALLSCHSRDPYPAEVPFVPCSNVKTRTGSYPFSAGGGPQGVLDGSADSFENFLGAERDRTRVSTDWVNGSATSSFLQRSESLSAAGRCFTPGRHRQVPLVAKHQEEHLLLYVKVPPSYLGEAPPVRQRTPGGHCPAPLHREMRVACKADSRRGPKEDTASGLVGRGRVVAEDQDGREEICERRTGQGEGSLVNDKQNEELEGGRLRGADGEGTGKSIEETTTAEQQSATALRKQNYTGEAAVERERECEAQRKDRREEAFTAVSATQKNAGWERQNLGCGRERRGERDDEEDEAKELRSDVRGVGNTELGGDREVVKDDMRCRRKLRNKPWLLVNDHVLARIKEREVLDFSQPWKIPIILQFTREDLDSRLAEWFPYLPSQDCRSSFSSSSVKFRATSTPASPRRPSCSWAPSSCPCRSLSCRPDSPSLFSCRDGERSLRQTRSPPFISHSAGGTKNAGLLAERNDREQRDEMPSQVDAVLGALEEQVWKGGGTLKNKISPHSLALFLADENISKHAAASSEPTTFTRLMNAEIVALHRGCLSQPARQSRGRDSKSVQSYKESCPTTGEESSLFAGEVSRPHFVAVGGDGSGYAFEFGPGASAQQPVGYGLYTPRPFGVCTFPPSAALYSSLPFGCAYPISSAPGVTGLLSGCLGAHDVHVPRCIPGQAMKPQPVAPGSSERHRGLSNQVGTTEATDGVAPASPGPLNSTRTVMLKEETKSLGLSTDSGLVKATVSSGVERVSLPSPESSTTLSGKEVQTTLETGDFRKGDLPAQLSKKESGAESLLRIEHQVEEQEGEMSGHVTRTELEFERKGKDEEARREGGDKKGQASAADREKVGGEDEKGQEPSDIYERVRGGTHHQGGGVRKETSDALSDETGVDEEETKEEGWLVALDAEFVAVEEIGGDISAPGALPATARAASSPLLRAASNSGHPSSLALARVSVVRGEGPLAGVPFIDHYVHFKVPPRDYLTRFSGLRPGDLDLDSSPFWLSTKKAIHQKLRYLVDVGCVFVGHGLSQDFRIINLFVPSSQVVDTVELFRLPGRRLLSLRFLAFHLLHLNIQQTTHDSIQDARSALLLYRKYQELSRRGMVQQCIQHLYDVGYATNWRVPEPAFPPLSVYPVPSAPLPPCARRVIEQEAAES